MKAKTLKLICLIAGIVLASSFSQIFFKLAALASDGKPNMSVFVLLTFIGFFLLGWSFLFSYIVLKSKPLSFLYPFSSLTFVLIPALASIILGTRVSVTYFAGSCLIIGGITLIALNQKQTT